MVHGCRQVVRLERRGPEIIGIGSRKTDDGFFWEENGGFWTQECEEKSCSCVSGSSVGCDRGVLRSLRWTERDKERRNIVSFGLLEYLMAHLKTSVGLNHEIVQLLTTSLDPVVGSVVVVHVTKLDGNGF